MKYITLEKNEYYFNLLKKFNPTSINSFWIYDIFQIDADLSEELQNVVIEIPENLAFASWFSHIDLNQRKTLNVKVEHGLFEHVKHSLNIPEYKLAKLQPRDKFVYTITEEDEKNSVKFIKTILLHYAERQFNALSEGNKSRYNKKFNRLKDSINSCQTNYDCHVVMHEHYNFSFMERDPETKAGTTKPGAKWDLLQPTQSRIIIDPITPEALDQGPTIDNIDPSVFKLSWEIGEPIKVEV